jgi:secondary thiamine-phosphate synthase enzyme
LIEIPSPMSTRLYAVRSAMTQIVAMVGLSVETRGEGFVEITRDARGFVDEIGAQDGLLFVYLRHTSASLAIQENADPDVRADLTSALHRVAPVDAGWIHGIEGPDDMPAHVKAMFTGVSLHVPVIGGSLGLGAWQGLYLIEHRLRPHRREVILQYVGSRQDAG